MVLFPLKIIIPQQKLPVLPENTGKILPFSMKKGLANVLGPWIHCREMTYSCTLCYLTE